MLKSEMLRKRAVEHLIEGSINQTFIFLPPANVLSLDSKTVCPTFEINLFIKRGKSGQGGVAHKLNMCLLIKS